jgi:peroxidase
MSDPELFNYAKNYVSALIAKITYDDYLPLLIGEKLPYTGYDKSIDPSVSNVFSTVALRFGHFTVPFHVLKMD